MSAANDTPPPPAPDSAPWSPTARHRAVALGSTAVLLVAAQRAFGSLAGAPVPWAVCLAVGVLGAALSTGLACRLLGYGGRLQRELVRTSDEIRRHEHLRRSIVEQNERLEVVAREREEALQALLASEERLRRTEEFSLVMVGHLDPSGDWRKVPALLARQLGAREEQLVGQPLSASIDAPHRADFERELAGLLAREFLSFELELPFRRSDGSLLWIYLNTTLVPDAGGEPVELLVYLRDLTERRAVEAVARTRQERLELAMAAANMGTWEFDLSSGRSELSPEVEPMFGIAPGSFDGRLESFLALVLDEDREAVRGRVVASLEPGADSHDRADYRTRRPSGEVRWHEARWRIERDEDGAPLHVFGLVIDVTEQRRVEEELRQFQKLEAIGQLAGGVAHDFNNILTIILGNTDLLQRAVERSGTRDELSDRLREIRHSAERGAALIQQLLAFGRKQVATPSTFDPALELERIHELLGRLLRDDVRVELELDEDLLHVEADVAQFSQIVLNLATNAQDAMPAGGTLLIEGRAGTIERGGEPRPAVELIVSDTGVGMDPHTRARIFEPFFTTKPRGKGTGLGLSTVYGLVAAMGGELEVSTAPGAGSTFRVRLPGTEPGDVLVPQAPKRSPDAGGREAILLCEDDEAVRRFVATALADGGYEVLTARDGREALALVESEGERIDLLVTDVVMPIQNGAEVAHAARRSLPRLPVLFISGYPSDDGSTSSLHLEGAELLPKPFGPDELLGRVRRMIDARQDAEPART